MSEIEQLEGILNSGNFDELKGWVESVWFECKGQPYRLNEQKQKYELAKDVSALANSGGGYVLIGVATEKPNNSPHDIVDRVPGVERDKADIDQYHNILDTWVYPKIKGISIQWYKSSINEYKGIFAIKVPQQDNNIMPLLVTRIIDESNKEIGTIFGLFERVRDKVSNLDAQRIQTLIRDGLRFNSLEQRLNNIEGLLVQSSMAQQVTLPPTIPQSIIDERINEALAVVGLQNKAYYVLAAYPEESIDIPQLFQDNDNLLNRLLQEPPAIRKSGWDMYIGYRYPDSIQGKLKRLNEEDSRLMELWRDGVLVFIATVDSEYLAWGNIGRRKETQIVINPIALNESVYNFVLLYSKLYEEMQLTGKINFLIKLGNLPKENSYLANNLNENGYNNIASETEVEKVISSDPDTDPAITAFRIVSEIWIWFGFQHNQIPYTEEKEGVFQISKEQIMSPKPK